MTFCLEAVHHYPAHMRNTLTTADWGWIFESIKQSGNGIALVAADPGQNLDRSSWNISKPRTRTARLHAFVEDGSADQQGLSCEKPTKGVLMSAGYHEEDLNSGWL